MKNSSFRPLALLLLLSAFVSVPHAKAKTKAKATAGVDTAGLAELTVPQKTEILRALDSVGIPLAYVNGSVWKRRKATYLVLARDSAGFPDTANFHLFAFDLSPPKPRLAAASETESLPDGDNLGGFDLAAYKIRQDEFAFGIGYSRRRSYAGGGATLDGKFIYRLEGSTIKCILDAVTSFEADLAGSWNEEEGTRDRSVNSGSAVLIVTGKKTQGYFDWLLKGDTGKTTRIKWEDGSYTLQGDLPFPVGDFEIFDDP
jgi:hypothetical protein